MNMMSWIFGAEMRLADHGVRLKYPPMNHTTPAKKSIHAMNASVSSSLQLSIQYRGQRFAQSNRPHSRPSFGINNMG